MVNETSIDIPTKSRAKKIARNALRYMAKTDCCFFRGDLADALGLEWVFANNEQRPECDADCTCEPCKREREIDRPILAAIQNGFSNDPVVIERLTLHIREASVAAASQSLPRRGRRLT